MIGIVIIIIKENCDENAEFIYHHPNFQVRSLFPTNKGHTYMKKLLSFFLSHMTKLITQNKLNS